MGKAQRQGAYRSGKSEDDRPENFGDIVTADHVVANSEESEGITGDKNALIVGDESIEWIYGYPVLDKSAE